ncbi:GNAT family N-acetyltransferase [Jannaschia aquimarina]|uniref:Putative acetyltransferase n=1 Tax=Jannaschia aquimarina TaxID=935700 RepID=A0A0D1CID5_9RHOB|nr:GNAT family N-acetyltransferase [Jannaschia aquimarina]KIT14467.1 putative acetyltransferase [Jannaschia aquimarina]SNT28972.1 Ribosomal protein S18 acetylase RimI [Jannaschia aquimarina]
MKVRFRVADRTDLEAVLHLLSDDELGASREVAPLSVYQEGYDRMIDEGMSLLIVGESPDRIVATYQITFISGISLRAARRAHLEGVRVASNLRGTGIGTRLIEDAESRARAAGCTLLQLHSDATRQRARSFYEARGFTPSHIGFKRRLL